MLSFISVILIAAYIAGMKEEVLNNERVPASMMMVPSAAGLILASYVIEQLII